MAPKRNPRRTGTGAAKATVVAPLKAVGEPVVEGEVDGDEVPLTPPLDVIADQPDDPMFTLEGIELDGDGKVDIPKYLEKFGHLFANEPPPDKHPDVQHPGLQRGEKIPKGLRVWDDIRAGATEKNGAGWVALRSATQNEKKRERWFNIQTCLSWRMAFLLAKLQRAYWDERAAWLKAPANTAGVASEPTTKADETSERTSTPKPKRSKPVAENEVAQKKARTQQPKPAPQPAQKAPLIGADVVAGSSRVQQILAERAAKAAAAAASAATA